MLEPESSSMEFCSWNLVHGIRIEKQDWNQDWNQDWGSRLDPNSLDFDLKTNYHPTVNIHLLTLTLIVSNCCPLLYSVVNLMLNE